MYIKISNFIKENGDADYKGLDIENINPGSQVYPLHLDIALFEYGGKLSKHQDVKVITGDEYNIGVNNYREYIKSLPNPEEEIEELKQTVADLTEIVLLGGMG